MKKFLPLLLVLFCRLFSSASAAPELVYADSSGVIRWRADEREVALFGANYSLPSATDFRAAGYVHADRKKLVEQDLTHFARMGWDAMRLCLWGDWENSDKDGNLIVNEHLDVMDYAIAEAKKRGVYILFTPITTYSAWWPDAKETDPYPGFSNHFKKPELGTNPAAIAAQCNYLRQILNHVNPYTGVALKDEPQIIFVEMINEPHHHAEDFSGSVAYINALADAVRSTGCQKLLFHNVSQDMRISSAIKASSVPGVTFAWYPTGLNSGHTLRENHLRSVDEFVPMQRADLLNSPKIVYEFDSADMNSGYMYPAMTRAFRGVGAQFAAMFSYDMLATAPYNLGWQTHFLNLVYSPKKAVSAIISAEVMREIPRNSHYGDYPENRRFGPFRVSYEEDSSEMVSGEKYLYANDTLTPPSDPAKLRRVVGTGSSPVVAYEGSGAYFIDQLKPGVWRLEVYPDAVLVQDPFAQKTNYQTITSRLVWHEWPMTVRLPDLGESFIVSPLNDGNQHTASVSGGKFTIKPGVYLLSRDTKVDRATLPQRVGPIGLTEFVCPLEPKLPTQVLPQVKAHYVADHAMEIAADVVGSQPPRSVSLQVRAVGETAVRAFPLVTGKGYRYATTLAAGLLPVGAYDFCFVLEEADGKSVRFPVDTSVWLSSRVVGATARVVLFEAEKDSPNLVYTRIGDTGRRGIFKVMPATATDPVALRMMFPLSIDRTLDDYTASLAIKDQITDRSPGIAVAKSLRVVARSAEAGQSMVISLVESDGTTWSKRLTLAAKWQELSIPLGALHLDQGVLLPLGFPGRWSYWSTPAKGRSASGDGPKLADVEHVQISFRPIDAGAAAPATPEADAWAEINSVAVEF